jgi:hypothetical protein
VSLAFIEVLLAMTNKIKVLTSNNNIDTIMFQMRSAACPWMMANVKTAAVEHDCGDSTLIK